MNDVVHWRCAWRIWGIFKKSRDLSFAVRRRRVTFASLQWPCGGCHTCCGGRWKSQNRKNVYISLCWRTFKFKGNKKFRTWTKQSSSVFRVSGFLCSIYICYEHSMYVSRIRIMGKVHVVEFSVVFNSILLVILRRSFCAVIPQQVVHTFL